MSELYTQSRIGMWQRCQVEHDFRYNQGVKPVIDEQPLIFGSAFHAALEIMLKEGDRAKGLAVIKAEERLSVAERAKCAAMAAGWWARWDPADKWDVISVEEVFQFELPNGAKMGGKFDAIVWEDGRQYIVEHKTTSSDISGGAHYWQRLTLDWQCTVYLKAAKALGYKPAGIIYDVARKPAHRLVAAKEDGATFYQRLLEAIKKDPGKYYARETIVRLEHENQKNLNFLVSLTEQMGADVLPVINPNGCYRYGRWCPYMDVCTGSGTLEDGERFAQVDAHEELKTDESSQRKD